jgi:hypothetical protein
MKKEIKQRTRKLYKDFFIQNVSPAVAVTIMLNDLEEFAINGCTSGYFSRKISYETNKRNFFDGFVLSKRLSML